MQSDGERRYIAPPFAQSTLAISTASLTTTIHSVAYTGSPQPLTLQEPLANSPQSPANSIVININSNAGSTGKGILIGILSAFGSAGVAVLVLAVLFFFRYTSRGRIILDRIGRPGEYDDEQAFAREEAEALESMDELQRAEYLRAKGETLMIYGPQWN